MTMLTPVLALVTWTLIVWVWMYATRVPAIVLQSKLEEVDRLLTDAKKIKAIKVLREATGLGLKLSKMAVEQRVRGR